MGSPQAAGEPPSPGAAQAAVLPPLPAPLFEHFVVCGLAGHGLQTVQGEPGFLGVEVKYKPAFLDRLPHGDDPKRQPPPQLPTCCLPAGVDIILKDDVGGAFLNPRTYAVVLTEGDGTKVYASCLAFYDEPPAELRARHEQLCGARALKAICLLSHQPYLDCSERVLREIYNLAFVTGSPVPVVDVIAQLMAVPCPRPFGPQVCFSVGAERLTACPPLPVGPPAGELSLQPLVEALSPHNISALFVAVLLERRVLLRCRQYRLLTLVAESVVRLLHPFKFQHVYIPVMPYSLVDYLEAPTPFLMGLHSADDLDASTAEGLVVVDLERDEVALGGDPLLPRCMAHPYVARLTARLRALQHPFSNDGDLLGTPADPWVAAARALAPDGWGPRKQALAMRVFLQFFSDALDGYEAFVGRGRRGASPSIVIAAAAAAAATPPSQAPAAGSASGAAGAQSPRVRHAGASAGGAAALGLAAGGLGLGLGRVSFGSCSSRFTGTSGPSNLNVNLPALIAHHEARTSTGTDQTLMQQLLQGLSFYSFAEEQLQAARAAATAASSGDGAQAAGQATAPARPEEKGWLAKAEEGLAAWLEAEAARGRLAAAAWRRAAEGGDEQACGDGGAEGPIVIEAPRPGLLRPPPGAVHRTLPALVLADTSGDGGGVCRLRRRTSGNGRRDKRQSVARRRAISEFSGGSVDLRRKTPGPMGDSMTPLRSAESQGAGPPSPPGCAAAAAAARLAGGAGGLGPGGGAGAGAGGAGAEYSAEADLVRRQTAALLALLAQPPSARDALAGAGRADFRVPRPPAPAPVAPAPPAAPAPAPPAAVTTSASGGSPSKSSGKGTFSMTALAAGALLSSASAGSSKSLGSLATSATLSSKQSVTMTGASIVSKGDKVESRARHAAALDTSASAAGAGKTSAKPQLATAKGAGAATAVAEQHAGQQQQQQQQQQPGLMNTEDLEAARDLLNIQTGGNGWFLVTRLKEELAACTAAASAAAPANALTAPAPVAGAAGCGWWERRLSEGAFQVLREMLEALVSAAVAQEDWRVVVAALQAAQCIACTTATGARRRLISELSSCPTLFCDWFWSAAFAFAVSAAYLGGENRADVSDVVAATLAEFAHLITGVGVTGNTAWLLLLQLASQGSGQPAPAPAPEVMAALRAHLAHIDAASRAAAAPGAPGPAPPPAPPAGRCAAAALPPLLPQAFARLLGIDQPGGCLAGVHAGCGGAACAHVGAGGGEWRGADGGGGSSGRARPGAVAGHQPSDWSSGGGGPCSKGWLKGAAGSGGGTPGALQARRSAAASDPGGPRSLLDAAGSQREAVHAGPVLAVAASNHVVVSTSADGTLKVLQTAEGAIRLFACLSLSPDSAGAPAAGAAGPWPGSCLALSGNGACGAVGNVGGSSIWLLDIKGGTPAVELEGHSGPVTQLQLLMPPGAPGAASSSGAALLSCSLDGSAKLWDARAAGAGAAATLHVRRCGGGGRALQCVASNSDGGLVVAAGTRDGSVVTWDVRRPDCLLADCAGHSDWVTQVAFAPAGGDGPDAAAAAAAGGAPLLYSASADWSCRAWDASKGECVATLSGLAGAVTSLAFLEPAGGSGSGGGAARVAAGCQDGSVAVWGAAGQLLALEQPHWAPVRLLAAAGAGGGCEQLVTGAGDMTSCLWDVSQTAHPGGGPRGSGGALRRVARLSGRRELVAAGAMAYDRESRLVVAGHRDGAVTAWHAALGGGEGAAGEGRCRDCAE